MYLKWCADMRHNERLHDNRPILHHADDDCAFPKPLKLSSISQRLAAIGTIHRINDCPSPTRMKSVEMTFEGIIGAHQRTRGSTPKAPLMDDDVHEIVDLIERDLTGVRDRAIILLLFLGAMRRSELADMSIKDVVIDANGLVYTMWRSKTNQHGRKGPQRKAIKRQRNTDYCGVHWTEQWCKRAGIHADHIFRSLIHEELGDKLSGNAVYEMVLRRVVPRMWAWLEQNALDDPFVQSLRYHDRWALARFDHGALDALMEQFSLPAAYDPRNYGAHTLRHGHVTTARTKKGASDFAIMQVTHHTTNAMLDRYTHSQNIWRDNSSEDLL